MLLTILIFLPLILGLLAAAVVPARTMKWAALFIVLADLAVAVYAASPASGYNWAGIAPQDVYMYGTHTVSAFQHRVHVPWPLLDEYQISYTLGVDNLGMLMILLTAALGVFGVLCSFTAIEKREKEFYVFLLALQTGILGIFCALDLILFFMAWEVMMLPLYFLIGMWGSKERIYATLKFVIYSLSGSLAMLLSILWIYYNGLHSFSLEKLLDPNIGGLLDASKFQNDWAYRGMMLAFLIKVPLWPLHTWLPDAHTEAPTAGSVILAGVLLKTGIYGILRFAIPLFPIPAVAFAPLMSWLAVIAIIYGALTAFVQKDMKRLVAYSSVSHMGFIVLGIFSFNAPAVSGAILQMINHGISTGGLFLAVGMIYERRHTRLMIEFGGLAKQVPIFAALTMVMVLSSVGLPGLNGFVGEFPILIGSMNNLPIMDIARNDPSSLYGILGQGNYTWLVAALAASGVIFGAVYLLIMYQKVFFGKLENEENKNLADLGGREIFQLGTLAVVALVIGLFPNLLLKPIGQATNNLLSSVSQTTAIKNTRMAVAEPPAVVPTKPAESEAKSEEHAALATSPNEVSQ